MCRAGKLPRRALGERLARVAALLGAPLTGACAGPWPAAGALPGPSGAVLLVANGGSGTVSRLDPLHGWPLGPPLPAGPAPAQIAPGPGGTLLALPAGGPAWRLTHVAPEAPSRGSTTVRELPLEPGGSGARLASDGQGGAVLIYHVPHSAPSGRRLVGRLVHLDVIHGRAGEAHTVCTDQDAVGHLVDVAIESGPLGAVAYVALWRRPALLNGRWNPAGGRILAIDPQTGADMGTGALPGIPLRLRLAPAPGGEGRLLYCLVGAGGPDGVPGAESGLPAGAPWCLLGLDPATLQPEREHALPLPVGELAITPHGDAAYLLTWPTRREVLHLDLRSGAARHLARIPIPGTAIAVTPGGVHIADGRDAVLVLDPRSGKQLRTLPVGRGAVYLALGSG